MEVRKMRLLRHKYGITRVDLGNACGISPQRISEIELNTEGLTEATMEKIRLGFETILCTKISKTAELFNDFLLHRSTLFDAVKETSYEL